MNSKLNIVSLFDGISCGRIALDRTEIAVNFYAAFEIDKYAKAISRYNYPNIKQCGDVLEADFNRFAGYDIVMGGSPCTFWSIAKSNREVDKSGVGWRLFMRFVEAVRIIHPRFFLYENVASMPQNIRRYISEELGVEPILINSALVSAQNRKRLYWTNIPNISQPDDKRILLKDILTRGFAYQDKSHCITATYDGTAFRNSLERGQTRIIAEPIALTDKSQTLLATLHKENVLSMLKRGKMGLFCIHEIEEVCTALHTDKNDSLKRLETRSYDGSGGKVGLYKMDLPDGDYIIRKLTPFEAERCQTLPDNYTAFGIDDNGNTIKISNTQRYKCIGNAWTVDIIAHILSFAKLGKESFKMKHIFSFDEINHGRIIIISDHTPSEDEVVDAIMNGEAYYHDTKYGNVRLIKTDSPTSKKEKEYTSLTDS